MFNRIKREWRFKVKTVWTWVDSWLTWYDQKTCPHYYRPAQIGDKVGRVCRMCDRSEVMSKEMFYAHFGEVGGFNK